MPYHVTNAVYSETGYTKTSPLWMHDYGQVLKFVGFHLPEHFEVHFSNYRGQYGEGIVAIGENDEVLIPDKCLMGKKAIYAWLFHHDTKDSGNTIYQIEIPILERARAVSPPAGPEQQDTITKAMGLLTEWFELVNEGLLIIECGDASCYDEVLEVETP